MRFIKLFEKFKETVKNTPIVYQDDNLTIKVVKTLDSSKNISDPQWCSTRDSGFYRHNLTANMYRFLFKDGYKLRLTWDYLDWDGEFSSGTHWGQGGKLDGKDVFYHYLRPEDENNPFEFNYHKDDHRQYMVDRITSLPKAAVDAVYKYQKEHDKEKNDLYIKMYKDIATIKVDKIKMDKGLSTIDIEYKGKKYEIHGYIEEGIFMFGDLVKIIKSKYAIFENTTLERYLFDKCCEWLKKNGYYDPIKKKYLYYKLSNPSEEL